MLSVFEKEFEYETVKIIKSEFHGFMLCPWFIHKKVNQSIGKCDYGDLYAATGAVRQIVNIL